MTDAVLGFKIDSKPAKAAVDELNKLTPAAAKAEAAVNSLGTAGTRSFNRLEQEVVRSNARITGSIGTVTASFGSMVKSYGAAFVGGLAAGGLISLIGNLGKVAENVAKIGDEARRAGVTTDVVQEWGIVAEHARLPVNALTDGIRELTIRAGDFAMTGKGPAADAFKQLGYGAVELHDKLKDPSGLLLEMIDRLGKLDKASQIRVADKIFGSSAGAGFVQLLDQGTEAIKNTIEQAHQLGNVMDTDLIDKAGEVDRLFKTIGDTVGGYLRGAIIRAAGDLNSFIDKFHDFQNQQDSALDTQLATIGRRRLEIEGRIKSLQNGDSQPNDGIFGTSLGQSTSLEAIQDLNRENEALAENERRIMDVVKARQSAKDTAKSGAADGWQPAPYTAPRDKSADMHAQREANAYRDLLKAGQDRVDQLGLEVEMVGKTGAAADAYRFKLDLLQRATAKGRTLDADKIADINKLAAAYQAAAEKAAYLTEMDSLKFERDQMFRSPTEQRVSSELRDAGLDPLSAQGQLAAGQIRLNEALKTGRDLTLDFASGLAQDLQNGVKPIDALTNAFGRLGDKLLDMALDQSINALFGNLTGGTTGAAGPLMTTNLWSEA
ncbi:MULTISPECIES: phage tail tape measure protein [unclassified Mesorhizobium]|uniref:phage tail tape measure protein n=1 Tax=unclassified Mesorhizobium TaxID=325217 RepID=UPI001125EEFC|nr:MULTISPECIES: phage tail tape measure protein [unclassified Mesorhizobium]TPK42637.1 phage tail tape measure protein [Mesorhizobium sp. B2-5-2]TPL26757.1 phage tail tape measure protein [Mesorhizobium sp. B2-4-7]TPL40535.1 phage tail tape measure protein [Mesorhizobium sp. B2-4-5]TPM76809.1 phage tail tape measure protein [Mesorhizobium sp. B2-1-6]TPN72472.1 phage tail tape measure protein [Mesorhizobium sp. B1-1-2]